MPCFSSAFATGRPRARLAALLAAGSLAALGAPPVQAQTEQPGAYCARSLGTWFYCAPPPSPDGQRSADQTPARPAELAELEAFQRQIDEARQIAVWKPTPKNVETFYRLQQIALNKGGLFADEWRRLIWTTPELDYARRRPVNEVGRADWEDRRSADRDLFLRGASAHVGLFFVFKGSCSACRSAAPIVSAFADRYGVAIKPISTDGGTLPQFKDAVTDQGQLQGWGVDRSITPALLIYQNPNTVDREGQSIPTVFSGLDGRTLTLKPCLQPRGCLTYLGAGVMAVEDIAERLFVLLATEPGSDF